MEGQFAVVDHGEIIAEFSDSDSAEEHLRALEAGPAPLYEGLEVKALCPECGEHFEDEESGVCPAWTPPNYDRSLGTLRRVLACLRAGGNVT